MPLTRAGDGSLGVRAVGGGQNAGASEGPKVYIVCGEKIQGADGAGYAPWRDGLECS